MWHGISTVNFVVKARGSAGKWKLQDIMGFHNPVWSENQARKADIVFIDPREKKELKKKYQLQNWAQVLSL